MSSPSDNQEHQHNPYAFKEPTFAARAPKREPELPTEEDGKTDGRVADQLVRLATATYRIGRSETDEAFAVKQGGPKIAILIEASRKSLRSALARDYYRKYKRTPSSSALTDALNVLLGMANDEAPEPVYLRVAEHEGCIVIDLGDNLGRAVVVYKGGWEVVEQSPVLFKRTTTSGALPVPVHGGSLDDLRRLLNVTPDTWPLALGWLIAAFFPNIPHPILLLSGGQGTGKSTAAKRLVGVVDPSPAPLRSQPRNEDNWAIAAAGSHVIAIDNVSTIPDWWSDALCKAVTGDGLVRRTLYTNTDLTVLSFQRVILLTSIDAGALRGDLGDRVLLVDLEAIEEKARRTDQEMAAEFQEMQPRILGAILDLLSQMLQVWPEVNLESFPRMADFARVLAAIDRVLAASSGNEYKPALDTYLGQHERIAETVIESDEVAMAIRDLMEGTPEWEGTAKKLLECITRDPAPRDWPKTPQALGGRLKRLAPAFQQIGVAVDYIRTGRRRLILLTRNGPQNPVTNVTVVTDESMPVPLKQYAENTDQYLPEPLAIEDVPVAENDKCDNNDNDSTNSSDWTGL